MLADCRHGSHAASRRCDEHDRREVGLPRLGRTLPAGRPGGSRSGGKKAAADAWGRRREVPDATLRPQARGVPDNSVLGSDPHKTIQSMLLVRLPPRASYCSSGTRGTSRALYRVWAIADRCGRARPQRLNRVDAPQHRPQDGGGLLRACGCGRRQPAVAGKVVEHDRVRHAGPAHDARVESGYARCRTKFTQAAKPAD